MTAQKARLLPLLLPVALSLAACQTSTTTPPVTCKFGDPMVETQLFFGLSKQRGEVTAAEWNDFVKREMAPRFAEGFTVVGAQGFWLNREFKTTISEHSKVVVRLHADDAAEDKAISDIVDAYKTRFAQESVLRVDQPVCAQF